MIGNVTAHHILSLMNLECPLVFQHLSGHYGPKSINRPVALKPLRRTRIMYVGCRGQEKDGEGPPSREETLGA